MSKILENSKEFFENMTDKEFESLLDEMGLNYTKVKPGEGGITYKGKLYKTYEEYDRATREEEGCITFGSRQCKTCENCRNSYNVESFINYRGCKVVDRYKNPPLRTLGVEGKCPYYDSIVKEERNK